MRAFEIAAFVTLSGAMHVAALTLAPPEAGGSGGGNGGVADVTLQAATPTLAAMVSEWTRPPTISDAPSLAEPVAQTVPERPMADTPVTSQPQATTLPETGEAPRPPTVETRLPAPPTPFAVAAPSALTAPSVSDTAALPTPPAPDAPAQQTPGPQVSAQPSIALPQVDTAPPTPRFAPQVSTRPNLRPDRPAPRVVPAPQKAQSAQRPAQKARGSGRQDSAAQAPARQAQVVRGPSKTQLAQAQQEWGARITRALRRAHRRPQGNASGTVALRIAISPAGRVQGAAITSSSGDAALDQAALAAVQRARFPKAPKSLTNSVYRFSQRLTVSR